MTKPVPEKPVWSESTVEPAEYVAFSASYRVVGAGPPPADPPFACAAETRLRCRRAVPAPERHSPAACGRVRTSWLG
ncbi:hypothetical protein [Streptomyces sp. KR80]|uniref:hypothetical protein n=1 Tax=Streptomyces sp. KR80 TaxID=3457426 RepID=UPI003FD64701